MPIVHLLSDWNCFILFMETELSHNKNITGFTNDCSSYSLMSEIAPPLSERTKILITRISFLTIIISVGRGISVICYKVWYFCLQNWWASLRGLRSNKWPLRVILSIRILLKQSASLRGNIRYLALLWIARYCEFVGVHVPEAVKLAAIKYFRMIFMQ